MSLVVIHHTHIDWAASDINLSKFYYNQAPKQGKSGKGKWKDKGLSYW
jgi:hypothetical protein